MTHVLNLFKVNASYRFAHWARRHFAVSLFSCQILWAPSGFSQRLLTSFGQLSDIGLGFRPAGLAVGVIEPNKAEIAVLAPEQQSVYFYEVHSTGGITFKQSVRTMNANWSIVSASADRSTPFSYITISSEGSSVSMINSKGGKSVGESAIPIQTEIQKCVVADLNNNKRDDLLFFGKTTAGVHTYLAQPNGSFKQGPVLFPDISISDLRTMDINRDGITDILALNWLSNQLTVFYGMGKLEFTEQVTVQLPAEPSELAVTRMFADRTFRAAITFPETESLRIYSGNSLGDYRLMDTKRVSGKPVGVEFSYLNFDDLPDLVSATSRGILVWLGSSLTSFSGATIFGTGRSVGSWVLGDVNRDGKVDCILVDRNTQRLAVLLNSEYSGNAAATEYAVGASPSGLVIADFNGNARLDIGVVNSQSSSLSLLFNLGRGRFSGQVSLPIPDNPTFARRAAASSGGQHTILVSHATDENVSVVTFSEQKYEPSVFSVPTGRSPFVVSAKRDSSMLRFLVRSRRGSDNAYLLSSFEQISPRQFVERSLRPTVSTSIVAMNVSENDRQGTLRLLFATNDGRTKRTTIWEGVSDSKFEIAGTTPLFSYPDSSVSTRYVLGSNLNHDAFDDVLVSIGPPRNQLGIWYGRGQASESITWIRNVSPLNDDSIILRDVDGDSYMDIVLLDAVRKAVVVYYGTATDDFSQPRLVAPAEGVHSIRVASLRENGSSDLILSNPERGTVSIFLDSFIQRGD